MNCPACNSKRIAKTDKLQVYTCQKCNAIFGTMYLGEGYNVVLPYMAPESVATERYFDFKCLSSKGIVRRHGWYDPSTRLITQVG